MNTFRGIVSNPERSGARSKAKSYNDSTPAALLASLLRLTRTVSDFILIPRSGPFTAFQGC